MIAWTDFYPGDFEKLVDHPEGWVYVASSAPVDEWTCADCGTGLGWRSDDEGAYGWVVPWCPSEEFDAEAMVCEDCSMSDEVELIPGVDYEVACCPICGRSDAHTECDKFIGSYPSRSYPHHDEDDDTEVGCAVCGETGLPIIGHADTCRGAS